MREQKEERGFKSGIGIPTVILVLLVLGLAVFACLSVKASVSELKLARSSAEAVRAYYEADAKTEEMIFELRNGKTDISGIEKTADERLILKVYTPGGAYIETLVEAALDESEKPLLQVVSRKFITVSDDDYHEAGFEITDPGFAIN